MLTPAAAAAAGRRRVELQLPLGAAPFDLEAAVCSHGLFMMAPNRWDPASRALLRPLRLASDRSVSLLARISHHPARPADALLVSVLGTDALSPLDQDYILVSRRSVFSHEGEIGSRWLAHRIMVLAGRSKCGGCCGCRRRTTG
jgi:hypothetical protein